MSETLLERPLGARSHTKRVRVELEVSHGEAIDGLTLDEAVIRALDDRLEGVVVHLGFDRDGSGDAFVSAVASVEVVR